MESHLGLPEHGGRRGSVEVGGMSKEMIAQELKKSGVQVSHWAKDLLNNRAFTVAEQSERIELVSLTVAELGFPKGATTQEIFQAAAKLGFELCPAEVGPRLHAQADTEQTLGEHFAVAMEPITDSDGVPDVFYLGRGGAVVPWLVAHYAWPDSWWDSLFRFVFRLRKEPLNT